MKAKNLKFLFLIIILAASNTLAFSQTQASDKLDDYFRILASNNKFMGSVSIFKNGHEIYSNSLGFADVDKQIANTDDTKYCIGSISKTFTAVLIFQAIEANKLSIDRTIEKYFPTVKNADKINIGHLLNHRSGIHNFTADETYPGWTAQYKDREDMVRIISEGGSDFEPGTKAQYSNSNYVLLSYILETIYHKPYKDILADKITKPLSLQNTYAGKGTANIEDKESNSYKYFDKWRIESITNPSITLGAGSVVSSPKDLNIFANALFYGKLVSANSLSVMQTMKDNYGMGLIPIPFYDKQGYGHGGLIDGFHSMLIYIPRDNLSYAITSNGLNYNFNDIHLAVLSCIYDKPFEVPNFNIIRLKSEDLDKYLGIYSSSEVPMKIMITKNGSQLIGQGTGQASFPLTPSSEHVFKFSQGKIVMEFNPSQKTMILKQGGGVFYFKKE